MVLSSLNLLVNEESDEMSLRSQKIRVTFSEEIEMDSLEPDINGAQGKGIGLGTIKEYEFNGQIIDDEFENENFNVFREFDVSFLFVKRNERVCEDDKVNGCVSLCSKSCDKLSHEVQL